MALVIFTGKIQEGFRVAPHWQGHQCGKRTEEICQRTRLALACFMNDGALSVVRPKRER